MSEQIENTNDALEGDEVEEGYDGDLGDGARTKGGSSAGIIGINPT